MGYVFSPRIVTLPTSWTIFATDERLVMKWQIVAEAVPVNLRTQLRSRTPAREDVPMAVREARASRFVSHQEGRMDSEKLQQSSNREHPLLRLQRLRVEGKLARLEELVFQPNPLESLGQPSDPSSQPQPVDPSRIP